jgi:hypothetical protein
MNISNINRGFLISHYKRHFVDFENFRVYHDEINGSNEDPYVWNKQFLWTFCNRRPYEKYFEGDVIFWVNKDESKLNCDCVFVVCETFEWEKTNSITPSDPIVDNIDCFRNHYNHINRGEHNWKSNKFKRYTLKADPDMSFLPHDLNKELINIMPFLVSKKQVINFKKGGSPYNWPIPINQKTTIDLYNFLLSAQVIIKGDQISTLHPIVSLNKTI